jgi:hypothetical protein
VSNFLIRAVVGALYLGLALWVLTAVLKLSLPVLALFGEPPVRWRGVDVLFGICMLALVPSLWRSLRRLRIDLGLTPRHEAQPLTTKAIK